MPQTKVMIEEQWQETHIHTHEKKPRKTKDDVSRTDFSETLFYKQRYGSGKGPIFFTIMYSLSIKMSLAVMSLNGFIHTFWSSIFLWLRDMFCKVAAWNQDGGGEREGKGAESKVPEQENKSHVTFWPWPFDLIRYTVAKITQVPDAPVTYYSVYSVCHDVWASICFFVSWKVLKICIL